MRIATIGATMLMLAGCDGILGEGRLPNQAANNLKAIGLVMHVYVNANDTLPPRAIMGEGGKPLLSWRVAMLPYFGMGELYREFKTDEPWDSPQNIKLLSRMPDLYRPRKTIPKEPHSTYLRAIVGPDTVFGALGETPKKFFDVGSFSDTTIIVVEAKEPVPWTKPDELEYDPSGPSPKLGGERFSGGACVLFVNGTVKQIPDHTNEKTIRSLMILKKQKTPPE
jgi:hypothetical protein